MIELALVKAHLRVDHDQEDGLIETYISAALSAFETITNRKLVAALPPEPVNEVVMSDSVLQGALLLIGHWYANRESAVVGLSAVSLPMATDMLWKPHRWVNV